MWLLGVVVRRYISPHCHPYFERAKFKVWMSIVESGCRAANIVYTIILIELVEILRLFS